MPKKAAAKKAPPPPPWPPTEIVERFDSLTADTQTVACALALIGGPLYRNDFQRALREIGARDIAGRTFSAIRARESLKELINLDWVDVNAYGEINPLEGLVNPILEISARSGRLEPQAKVLFSKAITPGIGKIPTEFLIGYARIAFFTRDWQFLETLEEDENRDARGNPKVRLFVFLSSSPYRELLKRLPQKFLGLAVHQVGTNLAYTQTPLADFLPQAYLFARDHPAQARFLSEILYFRGDIVRLEKVRELLETKESVPEAAIEAKQIEASIAFLGGDESGAIEAFRGALRLIKASPGGTPHFIRGFAAVFFLLALARSGGDGLREAIRFAQYVVDHDSPPWAPAVRDLLIAFRYASGASSRSRSAEARWGEAVPADGLTIAWQELWTESVRLPEMHRFDRLMFDADHAEHNGYTWLAAELYETASRFAEPPHDQSPREKAATLRAAISPGCRTAADVIRVKEAWEKALDQIEEVAKQVKPKRQTAGKAASQGRLAWVIDYDDEFPDEWELIPLEQKLGKTRKWNKPRAASPRRLFENPPAFLTDQDRRAVAKLNLEPNYRAGFNVYRGSDDAITELVGHPLLFLDEDMATPVELAKRDTQLIVQPASKGEIYLRLDPEPAIDRSITLTRDTPSRLFLTETTPAVKRLQELFGADGMTLPEAAKDRLLKAVTSLAGEIEIQSQISGTPFAQATSVPADATPQIHLVPYGNGLSAELLVQPIAGFGRHHLPGDGVETVFANDAEETNLQTQRDLQLEKSMAQEVIASCPSLAPDGDSAYRWTFPDPAACLELLTELHRLDSAALTIHWPKGETFKLKAELETKQLRMALKSKKGWFQASGEVTVDDQLVISMHELIEMTNNDGETGRFIQMKDGQFIALTDEFHRRLEELKAYANPVPGDEEALQINELAAYALEDLTANVQLEADKRWRDHVARLETAEEFVAEVPRSLRADLRPYQIDGYRWLAKLAEWGVGACLADDMGLGKTVQSLALLLQRAKGGPALVIAPTSVATNWMREAARFAPTLNVQQFGPGDRAVTVSDLRAFDLIICTFGLMQIENELLAGVDWHTVIIDEAQAIKNAATKRAKAAMKLRADFRVVTTGTPIENNLGELHTLFQFINPGLLGSREKFHRRFADPIQKTGNAQSRRWLKKLISPFILRRLKHDVLEDLPPRTEVVLSVEMSAEEGAFYEAIRQRAIANLETQESGERGIEILAEITRLRRACCNPQLVAKGGPSPASSKLKTFAGTLDDLLEADHKVLVFSQFVDHLSILRKHLNKRKIRHQYLDGSTTQKNRQKAIDAFQAGDGDVFLISLKAGGTGLNLTAADYVIHMDPWWNPASEDQASDRAHRIGQLRPVTVYRLVTKGTIEEKIVALHHEKRDLASSLLEGTDTGRKLDPEELLSLIRG